MLGKEKKEKRESRYFVVKDYGEAIILLDSIKEFNLKHKDSLCMIVIDELEEMFETGIALHVYCTTKEWETIKKDYGLKKCSYTTRLILRYERA